MPLWQPLVAQLGLNTVDWMEEKVARVGFGVGDVIVLEFSPHANVKIKITKVVRSGVFLFMFPIPVLMNKRKSKHGKINLTVL